MSFSLPPVFAENLNLKEMLSNKGAFPLDKQFAYQIKNYNYLDRRYQTIKVTRPFIDKISIKGDANISSSEDKFEFQKMIEHKVKMKLELDPSDYIIEDLKLHSAARRRSRYRYHYQIVFANGAYKVNLLFEPYYKGRFIKIEFNLKKLGKKGLILLARWFSENIIHCTFYEFISEPHCLGEFEIAIDCTGVPFTQFGMRIRKNKKDMIYESCGLPESIYPNTCRGVSSKIKFYDKALQCRESGEICPYPDEEYVTRVEIRVETAFPLTELQKIKSTYFKGVILYMFSGHIRTLPDKRYLVKLIVDTALKKGIKATLTHFPDKRSYLRYFKNQKLYFLTPFEDFDFWRSTWRQTLQEYGLENLKKI